MPPLSITPTGQGSQMQNKTNDDTVSYSEDDKAFGLDSARLERLLAHVASSFLTTLTRCGRGQGRELSAFVPALGARGLRPAKSRGALVHRSCLNLGERNISIRRLHHGTRCSSNRRFASGSRGSPYTELISSIATFESGVCSSKMVSTVQDAF